MIVIKIGGSLYSSDYLKEWLNNLASVNSQKIIIVPGGGLFADQVRSAASEYNLSDEISHHMAVLAMQQYGYLLADLNKNITFLDSYANSLTNNQIYVWMPYKDVTHACDFPKNWQTTSDSLAVWLAKEMDAKHLCLIKSAELTEESSEQLINSEIVDDYFPVAVKEYPGFIHFFHASQSMHFLNQFEHGKFS